MVGRWIGAALSILIVAACSSEKPEPPTPSASEPIVMIKPRQQALTDVQRVELGFPMELIMLVERLAGAKAEPFYETVLAPSENLKGEDMIARERLAGFSVRTNRAEGLISHLSGKLRARGYLIFRSEINYGKVPDVVTVIKGDSSYDILKIQHTEAPNYRLDTKAIISWLRARQKHAPFVITGAGPDWLEAKFIKMPKDTLAFARAISSFAPDALLHGPGSVERLSSEIKRTQRFFLWWD